MKIKVTILLRDIRKSKGLTLVQLAQLSGVSKSHISEIEKGQQMPSVYILCQLAYALGVSIEELVHIEQ